MLVWLLRKFNFFEIDKQLLTDNTNVIKDREIV